MNLPPQGGTVRRQLTKEHDRRKTINKAGAPQRLLDPGPGEGQEDQERSLHLETHRATGRRPPGQSFIFRETKRVSGMGIMGLIHNFPIVWNIFRRVKVLLSDK